MTALSQIVNGSTGLDVRDTLNDMIRNVRPSINVKRAYGAKGDGVTDDTVAIQAAIDAIATTGGDLVFDDGTYIIGGALKETSGANAQLILPKIGNPQDGIVVRFIGTTPPLTTWGSNSGAILKSTLATGTGQMVGSKYVRTQNGNVHDNCSWVGFYADDITFRMPQNPTNSCLDLSYLPFYRLTNCRIDVVGGVTNVGVEPLWNVPQPTTTTSYGIKGPLNDIPVAQHHENVMVMGFYTGIKLGELWRSNGFTIAACMWAIEIPEHRHPGKGDFGIYNCPNIIRYTGTSLGAEVEMYLDIEHNTPGPSGSGPSWVSPFGYDISDNSNYLRGRIRFHMHDTTIPFNVLGGNNLVIEQAGYGYLGQYPAPQLFNGFFGKDPAVHTIRRKKVSTGDDGLPWLVLAANQPQTQGFIGLVGFINEAIADGNEKRIAGFYAARSGTGNRGDFYFQTGNAAGQLVDRWALNGDGHFGTLAKGHHLVQYGITNGDLAGTVALSGATSATFTFTVAYGSAPAVIVTPLFDVGAGVRWWVTATASGFTINTSAAVTGSFSYHTIGNGS